MISEQHRQQYLRIMGIQNWMPRKVLAAAKPSILLPEEFLPEVLDSVSLPDGGSHAQVDSVGTMVNGEPTGGAASGLALGQAPASTDAGIDRVGDSRAALAEVKALAGVKGAKPKPAKAEVAKSSGLTKAAASIASNIDITPPEPATKPSLEDLENTPRFAVEIRAFESGLIMISDGQVAGNAQALLVQINRAFASKRQAIKDCHPFSWPLIDNGNFDQSEPIARSAVSSHLKKLKDRLTVKTIICLGPQAVTYFGVNWGEGVEVIQGPTVAEMLNEEEGILFKKQLWEKLKTVINSPAK